ncbi:RNA polymerase subunit sigma [Alsobacter soli]|uniref:RNA polymerase subunit sigma n=1 Tax=Alsobacter soli TaxID=2109933 RepID=A0A2T1HLE4_9HYPH|nr:RNA polymerase sigma factor [Alsobacter soli]PSC02475.1 RNA polymerase subunit sigma [Alsobacter soli]
MSQPSLSDRDMVDWPDAELVRRTCAGEGHAFAVIMTRYNLRLYRTARGILRDDAEAEDALQEAYVRAYSAMGDFRGEAGLSTWLTRIVMNVALGRVRSRRQTAGLAELESSSQQPNVLCFPGLAAVDPEAAAARAEVRRLLERAIDDLPEAFRVVFVMRDMDGMSIEETSTALGIRPETVKTRLHRARRHLREALQARLMGVLDDAFPFGGARCARTTLAVLRRLGLAPALQAAPAGSAQGATTMVPVMLG